MADWGQPRPRHVYTYNPRPFPGQKGVLTYSGPLNGTAAAHGYGAAGSVGYGMTGYPAYGAAATSYGMAGYPAYGGAYGVRHGAYYSSSPYTPYSHGSCYPHYHGYGGYGHGRYAYGRYANCFYPWQASYYHRVNAYPSSTTYVATTASSPAQYAYVRAAATPTKLPDTYHTVNYTTRHAAPTAEDIQLENRRVATERGAYRPRRIKPADAKPDDVFWCRERNGDWHCRPYYQIEDQCQPGRWQMDAEHGFLVFHRE